MVMDPLSFPQSHAPPDGAAAAEICLRAEKSPRNVTSVKLG